MKLTSDGVDALIAAAKKRAADIGIAVSVTVLDAGSNLKGFTRMDGAWLGSIDVAMRKARSSVLFEVESQAIWDVCRPDAQAHGLELTNGILVTFAGGIPLKAPGGELLGALGVSGGQVAQDLDVARSGFAAWSA